MALTIAQASDTISRVRGAARKLIEVKDEIVSLTDLYASLNVLVDLNQTHFVGENEGINLADFNAAVTVLAVTITTLKAGPLPSGMTKIIRIT